ncbi:MAG: DUF4389 domain-containing protein [Acidimicrobiia bacterium]
MSEPTFMYRHAVNPGKGLAVSGIFLIKAVLAIPHLIVVSALSSLAGVLAYIGFWITAIKGEMPTGIYSLIEIHFKWTARTYGWLIGYTDLYPPFETHPEYPTDVKMEPPTNPNKNWAIAGIILPVKLLALLPHIVALALVSLAAVLATWFGYFAVAFTGALPVGIQDFAAGVGQWNLRVYSFLFGITDEYPKFSLEVQPNA